MSEFVPNANRWGEPPDILACEPGDVHVWLADLDVLSGHNDQFADTLNRGERDRARRFVRDRDRDHFTAARGSLRLLLGRYLGVQPQTVMLVQGQYGKPALNPTFHPEPLRFNLSHSNGRALFAFSRGREVGIDIEYMRPLADMENIAQHFFSPHEATTLMTTPKPLRHQAFYTIWSRKEAFIKATGRGLAQSLASFDVSLKADDCAALLAVRDDPAARDRWSLCSLQALPDFAAALAVEGHDWTLRCWNLRHAS